MAFEQFDKLAMALETQGKKILITLTEHHPEESDFLPKKIKEIADWKKGWGSLDSGISPLIFRAEQLLNGDFIQHRSNLQFLEKALNTLSKLFSKSSKFSPLIKKDKNTNDEKKRSLEALANLILDHIQGIQPYLIRLFKAKAEISNKESDTENPYRDFFDSQLKSKREVSFYCMSLLDILERFQFELSPSVTAFCLESRWRILLNLFHCYSGHRCSEESFLGKDFFMKELIKVLGKLALEKAELPQVGARLMLIDNLINYQNPNTRKGIADLFLYILVQESSLFNDDSRIKEIRSGVRDLLENNVSCLDYMQRLNEQLFSKFDIFKAHIHNEDIHHGQQILDCIVDEISKLAPKVKVDISSETVSPEPNPIESFEQSQEEGESLNRKFFRRTFTWKKQANAVSPEIAARTVSAQASQ